MGTQTTSTLSELLGTFFVTYAHISSDTTQPALSARLAQFFDLLANCRTPSGDASAPRPTLDTKELIRNNFPFSCR